MKPVRRRRRLPENRNLVSSDHWVLQPAVEMAELKDIVDFLKKPQFTLYLGRKSCPLGLPLEPQIIKAAKNCTDAFQRVEFKFAVELEPILNNIETNQYYTEEIPEKGKMKLMRRDQPVNRIAWQFTERDEYYL